jgi:ubiquitin carboxyl-terminal hydrolase 4/11/15
MAYIKRNQSIIVDLMTGQYKSKVTCPDCKEESITFDPFITVTLPIPQTVVNFFPFFIIYSNMHKKTERLWLSYSKANAQEWLRTASEMTNLDSKKFGLYVVTGLEGLLKVGR